MADRPCVSVVISTFNRCESLALTLNSLARQQVRHPLDFEVIVVDNNSTDDTRGVVARAVERGFDQLRYEFEPRCGVSHGRNRGIRAARGAIVAFTDDDNDVSPGWVLTIKDTLGAHCEVDALGGPILPRWPVPPPAWLDHRHWSPLAIVDYGDKPFLSNATRPVCLLTANLAVRRDVFERVGEFSPDFPRGQDHEFLLRFWRAGRQVLYVPQLVAYARIQPVRLTRAYHREWHRRHGAVSATMQLQESIGPGGALLDAPIAGHDLFGTPAFVYGDLMREIRGWLAASPRGKVSQTFEHSNRIRYLMGYVRRRAAERRRSGRQWTSELLAFLDALWRTATRRLPLSPLRFALVTLLMMVFIGGSLYDIAADVEHWPLSPYPMFSRVDLDPTLESLRLVGVTREATPREIALLDEDSIKPFDQCRLSTALARTFNNPSRRFLGPELLRDVLERYEARRLNGEIDRPALQAVRAYRMTWTLDPRATNVNEPDVKRLVAEVRQ